MPIDQNAKVQVSAYHWVPSFAQGLVRDLRVRWALEEIGQSYSERMLDARAPRPEDYLREQPWGQVPIYIDGDVRMFESGAIVLYLAEKSPVLMPRDPAGKARVMCWVLAALNSVEPTLAQLVAIDLFNATADWAKERRPEAERQVRERLQKLSDWLGDNDYLEGTFSAGDLIMTTVLRNLRHTSLVADYPNVAALQARCEARPAFQRALADQMAHFEPEPA
jgi:glutathione S-transferase